MNTRIALLCAVVLPLLASAQEGAQSKSTATKPVAAADPRIAALAARIPGAKPEDLRPRRCPASTN